MEIPKYALGSTLRYYRGQFSPEQAYQPVGNELDIISMYNPDVEGRFTEAIEKHQGRFDIAKAAEAAELARIGEMETYDLSELNNRLKAFESGINNTVKEKYNGDYGAAANEIAKMIGTERTNPFYHFNKQKVEMGKAYLDSKIKLGANFLSVGNPFNISFKEWQSGKSLEFTPVNKEDIVRAAAAVGQNFSKMVTGDSGLQLTPDGQYFKNTIQYGIKDLAHLDDFIAKSGVDQQIYESMPELAGIENQDAVQDAIRQGLTAAIGTSDTRYLANQGYLDALQQARLQGLGGAGSGRVSIVGETLPPVSMKDLLKSDLWSVDRDKIATEENVKAGRSDITTYKDSDHATKKKIEDRLLNEVINNKKFSTPLYQLNDYAGITSESRTEIQNAKKNINDAVNNLQPGDLVGADEGESKALKNMTNFDVKGFSVINTRNPQMPLIVNLQLMGTPVERRSTGTPKPVPVNAIINPASLYDVTRFINYIGMLDNRIYSSIMNRMWELNPEAAYAYTGDEGKAAYEAYKQRNK